MVFVTVKTNIEQFRALMSTKAREVRRSGVVTQRQAAILTQIQAKRLAPRKTGETINNIAVRRTKRFQYTVLSQVSGTFKQNL